MKSDILISVVIPTYNRKERLIRCLDSVAENDLQDCEVIVVDDGSTDGTGNVISEKYQWVYLVCQQNSGVSRARNHGMEIASGLFVAFLDSDDLWYPERLAIMKKVLAVLPQQVDIIFNDMDSLVGIHGDSVSYSDKYFGIPRQPLVDAMQNSFAVYTGKCDIDVKFGNVYKELISGNILQPSNVLLRHQAFVEDGGFREDFRVANDSEYFLRLSMRREIAYVPIILTTLEPPIMLDSLSNRENSIEKITNMLFAIQTHHDYCKTQQIRSILLDRKSELQALLAYHYLSDLNNKNARIAYKGAITTRPGNLKFWIMWVLSFLPQRLLLAGGSCKHLIGRLLSNG